MYQFSANSIGAGIFDKRSKIIGRFRDRHLKKILVEDSERNDGSPEKPYFMSKELMRIIGKQNEFRRSQVPKTEEFQ